MELAKRIKERNEALAPTVGDKVSYVVIKELKASKGYEKYEDPLYVVQNNLPIDYDWYLTN